MKPTCKILWYSISQWGSVVNWDKNRKTCVFSKEDPFQSSAFSSKHNQRLIKCWLWCYETWEPICWHAPLIYHQMTMICASNIELAPSVLVNQGEIEERMCFITLYHQRQKHLSNTTSGVQNNLTLQISLYRQHYLHSRILEHQRHQLFSVHNVLAVTQDAGATWTSKISDVTLTKREDILITHHKLRLISKLELEPFPELVILYIFLYLPVFRHLYSSAHTRLLIFLCKFNAFLQSVFSMKLIVISRNILLFF